MIVTAIATGLEGNVDYINVAYYYSLEITEKILNSNINYIHYRSRSRSNGRNVTIQHDAGCCNQNCCRIDLDDVEGNNFFRRIIIILQQIFLEFQNCIFFVH